VSDGFFVAELALDVGLGATVAITGSEAHHAGVVRRLRIGEAVTVTNGLGQGVIGEVASVTASKVEVEVTEVVTEALRRPAITVVQALPKNDRADQAIDLMTEVGVDAIVPWQANRSIVKWSSDKAEAGRRKWSVVAREASKQARRLSFPTIAELATTAEIADLIQASTLALVMHEKATVALTDCSLGDVESCLIVIGPEGGLTDHELDVFQASGAQVVGLGPTVLRTSTAGAVAVTQARTLWAAQQHR
jgi:16S rRNA (uracil1498-N3)-methyltransferase